MPTYPVLSTQVIGQAESALGAILGPLLAPTGTTFDQWLVLTITAASGSVIDRDQLIARITGARKLPASQVETAIAELAADGLLEPVPGDDDHLRVALTEGGQARFGQIRGALEGVTARLFGDLPPEDLATAGRVLTIVTARAHAELIRG